jgi:hypothetical protein
MGGYRALSRRAAAAHGRYRHPRFRIAEAGRDGDRRYGLAFDRGAAAARMVSELAGNSAAKRIPEMYWAARQDPSSPENILTTGAVLLHARGVRTASRDLSPELSAALLLSAGSVVFEALLFRGMFDIGRELTLTSQRLWAIGAWRASWPA